MRLASLRLAGYRNLADQRLDLPPSGVAILGDNGQGKTNLLEAIYYLEIFRSFRGVPDEQLVRFGEDVFRVEARVATDGLERTVAAGFDRRQKRKKITVDGAEPERIGDAIGTVGAVIFSPSDVALVAGGPALRRRFLDIVLSLSEPRYLEDLQRYRQALLQRNALLRRGEAPEMVGAWNEGLVRPGSRIVAARARWVAARSASFAQRVRDISGGRDGDLAYEPSVGLEGGPLPDVEAIAERFRLDLAGDREREARRGLTLTGPHRDDLRLRGRAAEREGWLDLRVYGSGGQQRTAAVALRMVEAETLRESLGSSPVILLDDVFAELDAGRSRRILSWIEAEEEGQVILTAPKPADFELRDGELPLWRIQEGVVHPL
jgi:DNA replication and repair protein RecF